ncbi:MAG: peptidoglycan D,D-transpeptidase FtsI family protein [Elainellaceae cyanobacterium]
MGATPGGAAGARRASAGQGRVNRAKAGRPQAPRPIARHSAAQSLAAQSLAAQSRARQPRLMPAPASRRCPKSRLVAAWLLLVLAIAGLSVKLFYLQIIQGDALTQQAESQRKVSVMPLISRRPIVDRQNRVVATDRQVYTLYAHPQLFSDPSPDYLGEVAAKLAPLLKQDAGQLQERLSTAASGIHLQEGLTQETANQIRRLYLDGLELTSKRERFYPHAGVLAHTTGYVDSDGQGQVGVEQSYQDQLARPFEPAELIRGGNGGVVSSGVPTELLRHDDLSLKLTLDSRLQQVAHRALQEQVEAFSAAKGTVLVMDVHSGALRVMATMPVYDPNQYYNSDIDQLKNWVLSDLYEPGSTFKPINVAIALESGHLQPEDVVNDEGRIAVDDWPIQNFDYQTVGSRGALSVSEVLQYSSNVGMVNIMRRLSRGDYYTWLERLGLQKETGIDLPFESASLLKSREQFTLSPVESATAAFGQGLSLSPIHLLQLHAALANGGTLVTPHVVEGLVDSSDTSHWRPERPGAQRVFSPRTSRLVMGMMEDVMTKGTGQSAQIANYRLAGKTGTAQKASVSGGYSESRVTSFVGVLPANMPKYVVLALVDEPQGEDAYGGTVAAPAAKTVMEALIVMEGLPRQAPAQPESASPEQTQLE